MSLFTKRSVASITAGLRTMIKELDAHAVAMSTKGSTELKKSAEHARLSDEAFEEAGVAVRQARKLEDLLV
jgi:hypothetical protein